MRQGKRVSKKPLARSAIDVFSAPEFEDQDCDAFVLAIADQSVSAEAGLLFLVWAAW